MTGEEFKERLTAVKINGKKKSADQDRLIFGGTLDKSYMNVYDDSITFQRKKFLYNRNEKKRPKDSQFFQYLFKRLRTGSSCFKTYLGDLLVGKKGYIPSYINCFVKNIRESRGHEGIYGEIVSPRIADLIGVDTVFNAVVQVDENDDCLDFPEYINILSVDFTPTGYTFEDFNTLGIIFNWNDETLAGTMLRLERGLQSLSKEYNLKLSNEKVTQIKEDFIRQYLFRNILCEDGDFWESNMGMLLGDNGDVCMAPLHDLEHMFGGKRVASEFEKVVKEAFTYCQRYGYMNVVNEFMSKLNKHYSSGEIDNILFNTIKVREYIPLKIYQMLNRNMSIMNTEWKRTKDYNKTM